MDKEKLLDVLRRRKDEFEEKQHHAVGYEYEYCTIRIDELEQIINFVIVQE